MERGTRVDSTFADTLKINDRRDDISMPNEPVGHDEYKGRTALCDERFDGINKRQNKLEDAVDVISKLDVKISMMVEQLQKSQERTDEHICALEEKPGKRWDTLVGQLIGLAVAAGFGYMLSVVIK